MKKNDTQQEILLVTSSAFMQKELCKNDATGDNELSAAEKLEEACWNGMLKDWSWGTINRSKKTEKLFLWKVYIANSILCARASGAPASVDKYYSIDPYLFMEARLKHYS